MNPKHTLSLSTFPFEPTLFPKLQVYFADFPYLRCAIQTPEAFNLEDLMRLSVRNGMKIIITLFTLFFKGQYIHTVVERELITDRERILSLSVSTTPLQEGSNELGSFNYLLFKQLNTSFSEQIKLHCVSEDPFYCE